MSTDAQKTKPKEAWWLKRKKALPKKKIQRNPKLPKKTIRIPSTVRFRRTYCALKESKRSEQASL